jgi:hypothetical protein
MNRSKLFLCVWFGGNSICFWRATFTPPV